MISRPKRFVFAMAMMHLSAVSLILGALFAGHPVGLLGGVAGGVVLMGVAMVLMHEALTFVKR